MISMKLKDIHIYNQTLSSFVGEVALHYAMRFIHGSLHVAPRSQFDAGDVDIDTLFELDAMPDDTLCRIPGIGPATVAKLRLAASMARDALGGRAHAAMVRSADQQMSA